MIAQVIVGLAVVVAVFGLGYWVAARRRDAAVDLAVKRDRVARAWEDAAMRTVRIFVPAPRDGD